MKLTNVEVVQGHSVLEELEERDDLGSSLVWPIVLNMDALTDAKQKYDKAYNKYVQDGILRDDEGNAIWPEDVDPSDPDADPKFKDKEKLVEQLNDLLQKKVEVDIETVSREDFETVPAPKLLRKIRFMIEDL